MTNQQEAPEALWLADTLDLAPEDGIEPQTAEDAAAELRRQHTRIAELEARIKAMAEEHADELMVAHLDGRMRAEQPTTQPAPAAVAWPSDTFRGDTTCLVQSIIALLELDAEGALVPHGIGGHARALLSAAASRLAAAPTTQPAPASQGDALDAEQHEMDARHAAIYRWMLIHVADVLSIFDNWLADGEADTDELHDALATRAARAPADSVLEDAARYRFLAGHCRSTSEHWGGRWSIIVDGPAPKSHDSEDDFDEAVDEARKQGANHD